MRTGTEGEVSKPFTMNRSLSVSEESNNSVHVVSQKVITDFLLNSDQELKLELNIYILHKELVHQSQSIFLGLQDYFCLRRVTHTQKSKVAYLDVIDARADSKDTVMHLLHELHSVFIEGLHYEWLVVEGDGKLYEIVKSLQFEYGEELKWLITYPGDWHPLQNYQCALTLTTPMAHICSSTVAPRSANGTIMGLQRLGACSPSMPWMLLMLDPP